jgi:predicted GH43/DUF377 family glycosyl hydrolase
MTIIRMAGAVIIQPINYKYDHSYLLSVMKDEQFRNLFKFVCLFNPTYETVLEGEDYLERMHAQGFKGVDTSSVFICYVRFNRSVLLIGHIAKRAFQLLCPIQRRIDNIGFEFLCQLNFG